MDETTEPPASPAKLAPPKAARLSAPQKRTLKTKIIDLGASGASVTAPEVRRLAVEALGLEISKAFAEKLLSEFGYKAGSGLEPVLSSAGNLDMVCVWELALVPRPLTPAEKAQALADRIRVVSDSFVEDLLEDPLVKFAALDDVAIESTRSFALSLSAAVQARARFGAKTILPACADIANMTFKGALKP